MYVCILYTNGKPVSVCVVTTCLTNFCTYIYIYIFICNECKFITDVY